MHLKSDSIEIVINDKANKVIKKLFESLLNRYKTGLETSISGSNFIFDCVRLLYYKRHKINFKWDRSYIDSPDWMKNQKSNNKFHNKNDNKMFPIWCNNCTNL